MFKNKGDMNVALKAWNIKRDVICLDHSPLHTKELFSCFIYFKPCKSRFGNKKESLVRIKNTNMTSLFFVSHSYIVNKKDGVIDSSFILEIIYFFITALVSHKWFFRCGIVCYLSYKLSAEGAKRVLFVFHNKKQDN